MQHPAPSDLAVPVSRRRLLGVAGAALLAGCAPGTSGDATLDLWTWALRPRFDDYMQRLVADFERQRPGVRVRWTDVAFDAMNRKAFAAGAAGAMPDVINLSDQHFAQFANLAALRPIGPLLRGDAADRYVPGALAANRIDDQLFGLPWYLSTTVRVMNIRLLDRGVLDSGTLGGTWDALLKQAGPFYRRTGVYLFTLPLGDRSDLPAMMLADGLKPLAPHDDGGLASNLGDPQIVAFVERWVDAFRSEILPRGAATGGYEHMVNGLAGETVACINANALARVKAEAPQVYEHLAVGPGVVGKLGRPHVAVTHVAVTRQSTQPQLAAELAWHVTSPRWQTELAILAGRIPSTTASLDDPAFSAESDDPQQQATTIGARQLPEARAFKPAIGAWPDLQRAFDDGMKSILLGGEATAPALASVGREWDRILRAEAEGLPYK